MILGKLSHTFEHKGRRYIDYAWFIGEMKEHTYHLTSPLASTHGSCAKMFYLVMDVLTGIKTWDQIQEEFRKCVENNQKRAVCPLCKKYPKADLCVACVYDTEALHEVERLREALKKAKELIHSEYCSTDCSFHDFIDTILAGETRNE